MDSLGVQAWVRVHGGIVASIELLGGKQFSDVSNHIETVIDPLAAEYESVTPIEKSLFDALPKTDLSRFSS